MKKIFSLIMLFAIYSSAITQTNLKETNKVSKLSINSLTNRSNIISSKRNMNIISSVNNIYKGTVVTFTANINKLQLPYTSKLFIIGNATNSGWTKPALLPQQEFAKLDATTYTGIFYLQANSEYLLLPDNNDWQNWYGLDICSPNTYLNGDLLYNEGYNIKGPPVSGKYKITVEFNSGKYFVEPYTKLLPDSLFVIGLATTEGWQNPVPVPFQQFTHINSAFFEITLPLLGGRKYIWIPVNGIETNKFTVLNSHLSGLENGGDFGYNLSDEIPGPSKTGIYNIVVDFANYKFKVTEIPTDSFNQNIDTEVIDYHFIWYKNGFCVDSFSSFYSDNSLNNKDTVWCELIDNSNNKTITFSNKIAVKVFDTTVKKSILTSATRLNNENLFVKLYPNPSNEVVLVKTNGKPVQLILRNMHGKLLKKLEMTEKTALLRVNDLKKDVYLVTIVCMEGNITEKLIIE